jgi:hypothetical protein
MRSSAYQKAIIQLTKINIREVKIVIQFIELLFKGMD